MTQTLFEDAGWRVVMGRLPSGFDLSASARAHGAFVRARGVSSAESLLRLALIYGASALSLRGTAAWATATGLARLSDVALLGRLQAAHRWLGAVVETLLARAMGARRMACLPLRAPRRVRLIDATMIGAEWRVHADYDLGDGRFIGFALTDGHGNESLERFAPEAGDIVIADRYYAKARQLHHVAAAGADFLVRRGLTGCVLHQRDGVPFDLMTTLAAMAGRRTLDIPVLVPAGEPGQPPLPARLIIHRLAPGAAAAARRRAQRKAARVGQRASAKRTQAAGYFMLLTSLDRASFAPARVLQLYRLRWQIEIAFKRLKSLARLGDLAAKEPRLVRSCLYAKLILALLSEDILQDLLESSPSAKDKTALSLALPTHHPRHIAA